MEVVLGNGVPAMSKLTQQARPTNFTSSFLVTKSLFNLKILCPILAHEQRQRTKYKNVSDETLLASVLLISAENYLLAYNSQLITSKNVGFL